VHREHRVREHRRGRQHPPGGRLRLRPDPGHDRVPGRRAAHRRLRVALMGRSPAARLVLRIATAATLLFIYLPIALIVVYAFNTNRVPTWPPAGFTLDWFGKAAQSKENPDSLSLSLQACPGAPLVALVLGTLAAFAVHRFRFFGRETVSFLVILPIALPGIVTGIALATA